MAEHQAIGENSAHFDREFKGIGKYRGEFVEVQGDKVAQGRGERTLQKVSTPLPRTHTARESWTCH